MKSRDVFLSFLFFVWFVVLTAPQFLREVTSNDFWKHIYTGRYIAFFQNFPHHSSFTFSPVVEFLSRNSYNWLGNLFFYHLFDFFGASGAQCFRVLILLSVLILLWSIVGFRRNLVIFIFLVLFVWGINQKLDLRNAIFAIPGMILLFWLWWKFKTTGLVKWLYLFPILFLLWSNIHGSYIVGFAFYCLLMVGILLDQFFCLISIPLKTKKLIQVIIIFGISVFCVIFIKPFPDYTGLNLMKRFTKKISSSLRIPEETSSKNNEENFLGKVSGEQNYGLNQIDDFLNSLLLSERIFRSNEFNSPLEESNRWFIWSNVILFFAVIILFSVGVFPSELSFWLPCLAVLFLSFTYLRSVPYFTLTLVPLTFIHVSKDWSWEFLEKGPIQFIIIALFLPVTGFFAFHIFNNSINQITGQQYHEIGVGTVRKFSHRIPLYVLINFPHERAVNSYNIGSYLIHKWWPFRKVFWDTKSSAYTRKFYENLKKQGLIGFARERNLKLAVLELRPSRVDGRFSIAGAFPYLKNWRAIARDHGMIVYRKKVNSGSILNKRN